jgi:hypothetical protein
VTAFLARLILLLFAWLSFAASAIPAITRGYDAQTRHMDTGYDVPLLSAVDYDSASTLLANENDLRNVRADSSLAHFAELLAVEAAVSAKRGQQNQRFAESSSQFLSSAET